MADLPVETVPGKFALKQSAANRTAPRTSVNDNAHSTVAAYATSHKDWL